MLFNSPEFLVFLPVVFLLYWFVFQRSRKGQNLFLVLASYLFYGWWDWRFLSLIVLSSLVDYLIGLGLVRSDSSSPSRKLLLGTSLLVNLGALGIFKYYNFFMDSLVDILTLMGLQANPSSLNIILPVGISFYTFQTLSYSIDVYRREIKPTRDAVAFFAYVSFFPQLVAGPIERAKRLLPQFQVDRIFDYDKAVDGTRQILWGFFKKVVIADNAAIYVNNHFGSVVDESGATLVVAAILFSFQIYGDFSGYSDIAIGTARLFGFSLMRNFAYPYFSRDIAEFWRRWHISLSTWFRDYVYIPLGGSKGGRKRVVRNVLIIFAVSGLWHGANWTFLAWGLLNAVYFIPSIMRGKNRKHLDVISVEQKFPKAIELIQIMVTFILTTLAWVLFRADSIGDARVIYSKIFSWSILERPSPVSLTLLGLLSLQVGLEWITRAKDHPMKIARFPQAIRIALTLLLFAIIFTYGNYTTQIEFIYFQF